MKRLAIFAAFILTTCSLIQAEEHRLFVGTYTRGNDVSEGIYSCTFDDSNGTLSEPKLAVKADNPSFLAVHPTRPLLFACIETMDFPTAASDKKSGGVSAFRIGEGGSLTLINQQASEGGAPCHCNVDATGTSLLVANYMGGNVVVLPINEDGSLGKPASNMKHVGSGPNKQRQEGPHAHSINLSADNRFGYAADLGIDRILVYRFDAQNHRLIPSATPPGIVKPGSGPRHFAIHSNGKFAYTNNELTCEVSMFARDTNTGALTEEQVISTLPADFEGRKSTAECLIHPNGRFLYVSNRGHDSIAVYGINQATGRLTLVGIEKTGGQEPRNFVIDPSGRWLLAENQNSDSIFVFAIDAKTGFLTNTKHSVAVGKPVCIRFLSQDR